MATVPKTPSLLQGEAFGGGAAGGIAGVLTGALIGGSPEAAQAYSNITGAVRTEQTHQADLMKRYGDLQLQSMQIQQGEMQIEQLQQAQDGHVAQAKTFSQRAVANLNNIEALKKTDKNQAVSAAVQSAMMLDDRSRQSVAQFADVVNDEQTHAQAYQQLQQIADNAGVPIKELAPGLTENYQGKQSINAWMTAKDVVASTQQVRETERLENSKHRINMDMQQFIQEAGLEKQYRGFIYDMLLQQQNMQMRIDIEKIKNQGPAEIKRSDLESISPAQVATSISMQIASVSDRYSFDPEGDFDEELAGVSNEAATMVSDKIDKSWVAFKNGLLPRPMTQGEAIQATVIELTERMGTDGKIYEPQNKKLKTMKEDWVSSWIADGIKKDEEFANLSPQEQKSYALDAWKDPSVRRDNN